MSHHEEKQKPIVLAQAFGQQPVARPGSAGLSPSGYVLPEDKVPLPPPDAKVCPTVCDYCPVGCGYKAYTWPMGKEGGPKAKDNAFHADFPRKTGGGAGWWPTPNQHTIVFIDGKPHHAIVIPDGDTQVVNKGGNHSPRGGNIAQKCYSPLKPTADRLKTPLIRVGNMLQPISWEEATDIVAEVGRYVIDKYGEHAWGMKAHSYQFFENTYAETKLALQAVQTPVYAHHDKTSAESDATGLEDMGIDTFNSSYEDWELAEVIMFSGVDPWETKTVIHTTWIMNGKAKLIYALPRRNMGVAWAEKSRDGLLLQLYPGSDTPVYNAMTRYILEQGWEDKEFIAKWIASYEEINWGMGRGTRNAPWQWRTTRWGAAFPDFKEWLLNDEYSTLEYAEKVSGVPKEQMIKACEMLTNKGQFPRPKASFMLEKGSYWSNNYLNTISFANLGLICGAGMRPGQRINRGGGHQRGGINAAEYPRFKTPQRFGKIGRLALDVDRWVLAGNVRFMWVVGTQWINATNASQFLGKYVADHTVGSPQQLTNFNKEDAVRVLKARADAGHMVLVNSEIYLRDIAQFADVIFPVATWGEEDFTRANAERRIRVYCKFYDPPGESKPDWKIIAMVGKKMGYEGFDWNTPEEVFIEAARFTRNSRKDYAPLVVHAKEQGKSPYQLLRDRGTTGYQGPLWLRNGKLVEIKRVHDETVKDWSTPQGPSPIQKRFAQFTKTHGKAILHKADWRLFKDFYDRINPDRGRGELWVTSGRVQEIWQSVFDDMRKPYIMERYPMDFIEIHPKDAKDRGIKNGDLVAVENDDVLVQTGGFYFEDHEEALFTGLVEAGHIQRTTGAFTAMAVVTDSIKPGVAFTYLLWPGSPVNSIAHMVPDPLTNAPRYKLGKGKIRKIGETGLADTVTFASKHAV